jgi:ATP-binding cassette, subfamily F, member 3
MFVSHDRYFVERLATKIIEVGHGTATVYPGTYREFLWHKEHAGDHGEVASVGHGGGAQQRGRVVGSGPGLRASSERAAQNARVREARGKQERPRQSHEQKTEPRTQPSREEKKRADADVRKKLRATEARRARIEALEMRIAETETAIHELEQTMAVPGFYDDRAAAQSVVDKHQAMMWQVGDLMHQWEELQTASDLTAAADA